MNWYLNSRSLTRTSRQRYQTQVPSCVQGSTILFLLKAAFSQKLSQSSLVSHSIPLHDGNNYISHQSITCGERGRTSFPLLQEWQGMLGHACGQKGRVLSHVSQILPLLHDFWGCKVILPSDLFNVACRAIAVELGAAPWLGRQPHASCSSHFQGIKWWATLCSWQTREQKNLCMLFFWLW